MKNGWTVFCLAGFFLMAVPCARSYEERLIQSAESGKCQLRVEADDQSRVLWLRVRPGGQGCVIEKEAVLSVLRAAASRTEDPKLQGVYSSLYIGRLVDYTWLSRSLAEKAYQDPAWNTRTGRPRGLDINKYVSNFLFHHLDIDDIGKALGNGYRVISVTVEKVLVGKFCDVPYYDAKPRPGKAPFDAQVWLRLGKGGNE